MFPNIRAFGTTSVRKAFQSVERTSKGLHRSFLARKTKRTERAEASIKGPQRRRNRHRIETMPGVHPVSACFILRRLFPLRRRTHCHYPPLLSLMPAHRSSSHSLVPLFFSTHRNASSFSPPSPSMRATRTSLSIRCQSDDRVWEV